MLTIFKLEGREAMCWTTTTGFVSMIGKLRLPPFPTIPRSAAGPGPLGDNGRRFLLFKFNKRYATGIPTLFLHLFLG